MKKQIKENRGKLLVSSLVILVPLLWGLIWQGKLFWMPLVFLAAHWICILAVFHDWKNKDQNKKAIGLVIWTLPVMSLLYGGINSAVQAGEGSGAVISLVMCFGFGLMFAVFGNYFPKIRQNRTLGIRVKWALENEENWNATHRFSGKVWMASGLLCMVCGIFPDSGITVLVLCVITLVTALVPCLYSYLYFRRQLKEGRAERISSSRRKKLLNAAMAVGIAVLTVWALFGGSMKVVYQEETFTIETPDWKDLTVSYQDITEIEFQEKDEAAGASGRRTNGFGNFRMGMGSFENTVYGDYTRYTYNNCDARVVLKVGEETVVLNGPDVAATREIYETLKEKMGSQS